MEASNRLFKTFSFDQNALEKIEKEFYLSNSLLLKDIGFQDYCNNEYLTPIKLSPIEKSKSLSNLIGNKNVKQDEISYSNEQIFKSKASIISSFESESEKKNNKIKILKNPSLELKFKRRLDFYKEENVAK